MILVVSDERCRARGVLHFKESLSSRLLKNVMSTVRTRQKLAKTRTLPSVGEHFEPGFNEVLASAIIFQQPVNRMGDQ